MSNYGELKDILEKTGLLYSEWKTSEFHAESFTVKELSLIAFANKDEIAEFVFKPDGTFIKIRSVS